MLKFAEFLLILCVISLIVICLIAYSAPIKWSARPRSIEDCDAACTELLERYSDKPSESCLLCHSEHCANSYVQCQPTAYNCELYKFTCTSTAQQNSLQEFDAYIVPADKARVERSNPKQYIKDNDKGSSTAVTNDINDRTVWTIQPISTTSGKTYVRILQKHSAFCKAWFPDFIKFEGWHVDLQDTDCIYDPDKNERQVFSLTVGSGYDSSKSYYGELYIWSVYLKSVNEHGGLHMSGSSSNTLGANSRDPQPFLIIPYAAKAVLDRTQCSNPTPCVSAVNITDCIPTVSACDEAGLLTNIPSNVEPYQLLLSGVVGAATLTAYIIVIDKTKYDNRMFLGLNAGNTGTVIRTENFETHQNVLFQTSNRLNWFYIRSQLTDRYWMADFNTFSILGATTKESASYFQMAYAEENGAKGVYMYIRSSSGSRINLYLKDNGLLSFNQQNFEPPTLFLHTFMEKQFNEQVKCTCECTKK